MSLAGRVIASHYAEPLTRVVLAAAPLQSEPDHAATVVVALSVGDELRILDNSRGWIWGYGPRGEVGYVRSDALLP